MRLYQGPPNVKGVLYDNGMRFHGVDVLDGNGRLWSAPVVRHEGETVTIRLWWSADKPIDMNYGVGTYIRANALIAQIEGEPQVIFPESAPQETSHWKTNQLYFEERTLKLPDQFNVGEHRYGLALAVYNMHTNDRIIAKGEDNNHLLPLVLIIVKAW